MFLSRVLPLTTVDNSDFSPGLSNAKEGGEKEEFS
jgi:hypothetical protein